MRSSATISEASAHMTSDRSSPVMLGPLRRVAREIDVERAPVRVLPEPIERLRIVEMNLAFRASHAQSLFIDRHQFNRYT